MTVLFRMKSTSYDDSITYSFKDEFDLKSNDKKMEKSK